MESKQIRTLEEALETLESGIRDFMDSDAYQKYLSAIGRFHNYSSGNILLITSQRPDATLVAGYTTWKKMNRQVKKGERGIRIIAPVPVRVEKEEMKKDELGNLREERVAVTVPRFRMVTVFDVTQTEGELLPNIAPRDLRGSVENYRDFLTALLRASRVPVSFSEIGGGPRGYFDIGNERIVIREGMSEAQTVKTLVHEMAHSFLHSSDSGRTAIPQKTKEVEAESAAFAVCSRFGIDTSDYTFPYVSGWSGEQDLGTLKASMDQIREVSSRLIHRIEYEYENVLREKELPAVAAELAGLRVGADDRMTPGPPADPQRTAAMERLLDRGNVDGILRDLREYSEREGDMNNRRVLEGLIGKVERYLPRTEETAEKGGWER